MYFVSVQSIDTGGLYLIQYSAFSIILQVMYGYVRSLTLMPEPSNKRGLKDANLRDLYVLYALRELALVDAPYLTINCFPHLMNLKQLTSLTLIGCTATFLTGMAFLVRFSHALSLLTASVNSPNLRN